MTTEHDSILDPKIDYYGNYVPHDREVDRERGGRLVVAIISISVTYLLAITATGLIGFFSPTLALVGTILFFSKFLKRFLKIVPNYQAYITNDVLKGDVVVYGPGLHFSYPWEEAHKEGNYSLKIVTKTFPATVATLSDELLVDNVLKFMPLLSNMKRFASMGASTIEDAVVAEALGLQSKRASKEPADDFRSEIVEIGKAITTEMRPKFPEEFGILFLEFLASDIDYSKEVQKARSAIAKAAQLKKVADKIGEIPNDLRRLAMAAAGDIEYKVIDTQNLGTAGLAELASGGSSKNKED